MEKEIARPVYRIAIFDKSLFFIIKYIAATIFGVVLVLAEGVFRRIKFVHYERLPLWEGNVIPAMTHNSWFDVILANFIYFPWWLERTEN